MPIDDPQPSQLYLNGRKLSLATEWFDFDIAGPPERSRGSERGQRSGDPAYDPVPVVELDGDLVLTDGHTRAFLAWLSGAEDLRVRRDTDDLPLALYRRCVEWCRDEDITAIGDLAGRAVNADTYEEAWVDRCHRAAEELADDTRSGST